MSLLGGFLPTYAQIGVWSYVLFCFLRLLMGVFFGGEYSMAHTFAIEYAPQKRRGAIGGFIQSGFPLGYVFGSLVLALVSYLSTTETMYAYGWRIVFMTGIVSGVCGAVYSNQPPRVSRIREDQGAGQN